jgi:hypothetical protein
MIDASHVEAIQHGQLNVAHFGWQGRIFRAKERDLEFGEEAGRVVITAQREDPGVWTDLETADYTTGTSSTDVFDKEAPTAPTALTATATPGFIKFVIGQPTNFIAGSVLELWEYTASTPFASATKVAELSRGDTLYLAKRDTTTRYYWVRHRFPDGQTSSTYPSSAGQAGVADTVQTGDIAPGAATVTYSASGSTGIFTDSGSGNPHLINNVVNGIVSSITPSVNCTVIITITVGIAYYGGSSGAWIAAGMVDGSSNYTIGQHYDLVSSVSNPNPTLQAHLSVVAGTTYTFGIFTGNNSGGSTANIGGVTTTVEFIQR